MSRGFTTSNPADPRFTQGVGKGVIATGPFGALNDDQELEALKTQLAARDIANADLQRQLTEARAERDRYIARVKLLEADRETFRSILK